MRVGFTKPPYYPANAKMYFANTESYIFIDEVLNVFLNLENIDNKVQLTAHDLYIAEPRAIRLQCIKNIATHFPLNK